MPFVSTGDNEKAKSRCPKNIIKRWFREPVTGKHDFTTFNEKWGFREVRCDHCGLEITIFELP